MKIILHIGNGKTGTSSIQDSLLESGPALSQHGVRFLGFMLELAPVQVASWQRSGLHPNHAFLELTKNDVSVAKKQILDALQQNISALEAEGTRVLIWSNERFFNFPQLFVEPLLDLAAQGHDVEVVAYVRRHDSWAKSVHNQWHIKRKRNAGKNISFRDFIASYKVAYAPPLRRWDRALGERLRLRNFDFTANVVEDFCEVAGIDSTLVKQSRSNETPAQVETVLRVLFNERFAAWAEGVVDTMAFDRLLKPDLIDFTLDPVELANDVLPSEEDLQNVVKVSGDDRDEVNAMLTARGEAELGSSSRPVHPVEVHGQIFDSVMFQILAQQANEIQLLKDEVSRLGKRLDAGADPR